MAAEKEERKAALTKKRVLSFVVLLLSLLITLVIISLRDRIARFSSYGYLGIFVISLLGNATVILPAPSLLAVGVGGGIFNPLIVGLVAGPAEALGELTGYLAGYGGRAAIEDREMYARLERWMKRRGDLVIFLLSAIPNPLFDLAGIAAGSLRFPIWRFLLVCWLGKTLKDLAVAQIGAQAMKLLSHIWGFQP